MYQSWKLGDLLARREAQAVRILIARSVTEGPATREDVRSTLKTDDHGKMMADEEKIAVVAVVSVNKN